MPMIKGHSKEVVQKNIKEMIASGHDPKQAVAASMSMARKSKKMAEGGMVDWDDDQDDVTNNSEDAQRSLGEIQAQGRSLPQDVENPEMEMHQDMLAKALFKKSQDRDSNPYAQGGMVDNDVMDEHRMLTMADGGLVEGTPGVEMEDGMPEEMSGKMGFQEGGMDTMVGNKPTAKFDAMTGEPLSSMPMKPEAMDNNFSGLSDKAKEALMMRKKKRMYS